MTQEVKLPRLGQGMEAGTIVKWLKAEGDAVAKGEPLYELDTDKVTQEVEADAAGVLLKIVVAEGEVPVGETVAVIGQTGETIGGDAPAEQAAAPEAEAREAEGLSAPAREDERERGRGRTATVEEPEHTAASGNERRIKASPVARRIARHRGIDLAALTGTGWEGRVVAADVESATAAPAGVVERVPLTQLRKTVARRLTKAWEAPAFQITMSANMTRALALRAKLVERHPGERPTLTDMLTKLSALALMRHRYVNAIFTGEAIVLHASAHVGIAVASAKGLVVPVIRSAEQKTIGEVAAARAALVRRARDGKLTGEDIEGGTFTISNLGMYGVEQFVAVLNPPQAAILAVGGVLERPVVEDGAVVVRPLMTMTLTCDHRAVDGAAAADFLRTIKELLEEPALSVLY
ncbi:MAG: dihydrolipoamide acetyltransferase family protein [Solirubrobacteraceae bacterium]